MSVYLFGADNSSEPCGIELATRKNTHIDNFQCRDELTLLMKKDVEKFEKTYGFGATRRTDASTLYNCHGLTFACRRAEINDVESLKLILDEDDYAEVDGASVLPGDVMIYFDETGDMLHSAIVVERKVDLLTSIRVVSKWGKGPEYVHNAYNVPYKFTDAKYFRVQL